MIIPPFLYKRGFKDLYNLILILKNNFRGFERSLPLPLYIYIKENYNTKYIW